METPQKWNIFPMKTPQKWNFFPMETPQKWNIFPMKMPQKWNIFPPETIWKSLAASAPHWWSFVPLHGFKWNIPI